MGSVPGTASGNILSAANFGYILCGTGLGINSRKRIRVYIFRRRFRVYTFRTRFLGSVPGTGSGFILFAAGFGYILCGAGWGINSRKRIRVYIFRRRFRMYTLRTRFLGSVPGTGSGNILFAACFRYVYTLRSRSGY